MTAREKRNTIYILYCAVVIVLVIVIALIYRPHASSPVATKHIHQTTQRHPAGSSTSRSGSTPIAVNGNGKGTQHISGVSTASPSSASATSTAAQQPLSNSGPGNVIGLFALVSVLGSLAWRRKLIRSVIR